MDAKRPIKVNNGTIECHLPHQQAWFDTYTTCIAFQMPLYLERLYFGHISFIVSIGVLVISIFGNIKHTYKYFFINQALWDILLSYDFICDRPTNRYYYGIKIEIRNQWDEKPSNCIYQDLVDSSSFVVFFLSNILLASITATPYCSTFLLSFSRFLAIFCHHFYQKFITPIKVAIFIIIFTFGFIVFKNSLNFYPMIVSALNSDRCKQLWCPNSTICPIDYNQCVIISLFEPSYITFLMYSSCISSITPAVIVIITIVFMIANLSKITLQLYRQHKLKQKLVFSNFKIALVLATQCLTLMFIFFVRYFINLIKTFKLGNSNNPGWPSWTEYVDFKSLTILKSVIDSVITLTVLSEYRQNIFRAFKFVVKPILKPFGKYQIFSSFKSETSNTIVFLKSSSKIKMSY